MNLGLVLVISQRSWSRPKAVLPLGLGLPMELLSRCTLRFSSRSSLTTAASEALLLLVGPAWAKAKLVTVTATAIGNDYDDAVKHSILLY